MKYSVIDLFAGAGGLSLGFEQTKKFEIKAAFENNPNYQKTYIKNYPRVKMYSDVCKIDYEKIKEENGNVDVVIGGPPCQGFSSVNRQKNQAISQNNMLIKQFVRAIRELQPKAFVMENVSLLKSEINRFYLETGDLNNIKEFAIPCIDMELVLLEKKFFFDGVEKIVRDHDSIGKLLWTDTQYSIVNVIYKKQKNVGKLANALGKNKNSICKQAKMIISVDTGNKDINSLNKAVYTAFTQYYENLKPAQELISDIEQPLMVQRMLRKLKEISDNNIIVNRYDFNNGLTIHLRSFAVFDYINNILGSEKYGYVLDSGVLCAADFGVPQKRMRFVIIGIKKHISKKITLPEGHIKKNEFAVVKDAISDIADILPTFNVSKDTGINLVPKSDISILTKQLRNSHKLYNHVIPHTGETAIARFASLKQGENFHDLDTALKENTYTDVSRTQNTIYVRLNYIEPCGTVVNVRKSMWIHPVHNRAISIREAARLQTFPDSFIFVGTKDEQYQQVGNAVPPFLAKAIANKLLTALEK
jgi:DNA (cytosine-5)-methyltransferase 1